MNAERLLSDKQQVVRWARELGSGWIIRGTPLKVCECAITNEAGVTVGRIHIHLYELDPRENQHPVMVEVEFLMGPLVRMHQWLFAGPRFALLDGSGWAMVAQQVFDEASSVMSEDKARVNEACKRRMH